VAWFSRRETLPISHPAMALKATRKIAAPIGQVFDLLDDPKKMKQWMQGLEETVYTSQPGSGQSRVGTTFRQKLREGGRVVEYDGEVTAYDKPHRLGVRIGNEHFSVDVDYRLSEIEGGTRLDYEAELAHKTRKSSIFDALFRPLTANLLRRQMNALKRVAESR
jgi:uncharacterized protein YndB with AHSA1/START domain